MTVYAFGQQHTYAANGSHNSDLYYYSLAGDYWASLDNPSHNDYSMILAILLNPI